MERDRRDERIRQILALRGFSAEEIYRIIRQIEATTDVSDQPSNSIIMFAYSSRAEARLEQREFESALSDADIALLIEPKNVQNLVLRGKALHGLGLFGKACNVFKSALTRACNPAFHVPPPEQANVQNIWAYISRIIVAEQPILKLREESIVAHKQSQTGKYDLTEFFSRGCEGKVPACADYVGPVDVRRVGTEGRGLFATKNLKPGELLLVSNPLAVVRTQIPMNSRESVLEKLVGDLGVEIRKSSRQLARLHSHRNDDVIPSMELFRPGSSWMPPGLDEAVVVGEDLIVNIVKKKRFEYVEIEGPNDKGAEIKVTGLWILPAFAKHSCAPNCQHSLVGDTIFLRASKPIMRGQQLTVPYFNRLHDNVAARRARSNRWMFTCECERCVFECSLQPQLSKLRKELQHVLVDEPEPPFLNDQPLLNQLATVAEAVDSVEAAISSLVQACSPKQRCWIRPVFSDFYVTRFERGYKSVLEYEFDSARRVKLLRSALESLVSVYIIPKARLMAAELIWEVDRSFWRRQKKDYRDLKARIKDEVLGIYRLVFGELPKKVLLDLIEARYPFPENWLLDP